MGLTIVKAVTSSPDKIAEYEKRHAELMSSIRQSRPDIIRSGMFGFGILILAGVLATSMMGLPSKQKLQYIEDTLYKRQISKKEENPLATIGDIPTHLLQNNSSNKKSE